MEEIGKTNLQEISQTISTNAADLVSTWGLRVVGAIAVLIVGWVVARIVHGSVRKGLAKANVDETLAIFGAKAIRYGVLVFVGLAVLNLFGVQTASFIAVLGAAGLAIGLAMQGTLANFAAGVMLLLFRPFGVGDFVDVGGTSGSVKEIGIFSVTMNTPDNVRVTVPNSAVYGQTIKNFTANDTRRNDLVMGVSYDDDLGKAKSIIEKVLGADERVLTDPAPVVAVSELADSSVNFVVRPWCTKEDYWNLRFDLTRTLKEELEAAGCSIPFPQADVHVHETKQAS